jgi:hypothetical protein
MYLLEFSLISICSEIKRSRNKENLSLQTFYICCIWGIPWISRMEGEKPANNFTYRRIHIESEYNASPITTLHLLLYLLYYFKSFTLWTIERLVKRKFLRNYYAIFYSICCVHLTFYSINHNKFGQKNEITKLLRVIQIALSSKVSPMSAAAWEGKFDLERSWLASISRNK